MLDRMRSASWHDMPAWAISLVAHVAILLILASITTVTMPDFTPTIISSIEEISPDEYKVENATVVDQIGSDSDANMLSLSKEAATQFGNDPQREMERQLEEENLTVELPPTEPISEPSEAELVENVQTTGATEHAGGVEGAIDRLTLEIAGSLKEQKTLVVWLFDVSPSVSKRRDAIVDRFENVYKQLGMLDVDADRALKTAVVAFGAKTYFITDEPVDNVQEVVSAVRKIDTDNAGEENVFSAIHTVNKKWLAYRTKMRRNMMVIVVTDEVGSDQAQLEETLLFAKRYGIRIYVVGNAAPFGRKTITEPFEFPNGDIRMSIADRGPETVAPERLQLPFWGSRSSDLQDISSGFGPYALTRLCAETNGLFFIAQETNGPRFDPTVMRSYVPDYSPVRMYELELTKNLAKGALVQTAMMTWSAEMPTPRLRFQADNDNILRQQITEAQKPFAVLDAQLQQLMASISRGEKDREKLKTPRWRASYDLAMGRVLAMRVRAFGYNVVLAEMKSSPKVFEKKDSNSWSLQADHEISGGAPVKKLAKLAAEYLARVVDEHPGTPWAEIARRELETPMGWKWVEGKIYIPTPESEAERRRNPQFQREEQERQRRQKMLAQPPVKI